MATTRKTDPRKSAGIDKSKVQKSKAALTTAKAAVAKSPLVKSAQKAKRGVGAKTTAAAKTSSGKIQTKSKALVAPAKAAAKAGSKVAAKVSSTVRTQVSASKPLSESAVRAVASTAKTAARAVSAVEKAMNAVKKSVSAVKKGAAKSAPASAAKPAAKAVKGAAKAAKEVVATKAGKAVAKVASKVSKDGPAIQPAPKVGALAPDFELEADDGSKISLESLRGKNVVLYFYPRDMTPGCTVEACGFRDHYDEIEDKNAIVLGVSRDTIASHLKFKAKENLPFPLLSDPEGEMIAAYGSWGEKSFMGRKSMGILRTTVLIDGEGKVRKVYPKVSTQEHATEVLKDLAALEA